MNKTSLSDVLAGAKNWTTVQENLVEINNNNPKLAGNLFEEFCYFFFRLDPSISPEYQNVWLERDIPTNVRKELVLADTDHGADLVLQHKDGSYHVVQCKFKNDSSHVLGWTTDNLSSALAEADHAKGLVIFTNASDVMDHVREKAIRKHFQLFAWQDLIELPSDFFMQAGQLSKGLEPPKREFFKPMAHQEKSIAETIMGFTKENRGQLILPCGAGKTLASLWIMEGLKTERTLVAVPSLSLLRQFRKDWLSQQKNWIPNICVCSDEKVTQLKIDEPLTRPDELGTPVTTKSNDIKNFLISHKQSIVYTTYQSLPKLAEAIKGTGIMFDLAVCDEAHRTAGARGTTFNLIHDDKYIPIKKRLYMTATPRIVGENIKKQLNEMDLDLLYDMSDPKVFGQVFYRMSFAEAINADVLVDYQIVGIGVTNEQVKEKIDLRAFAEDGITVDELANNYALDNVMGEFGAGHAVTFHSSVLKASDFRIRHNKIFPKTSSFHVSGRQNTYNRAKAINSFETIKPSVITNARCLSEGVDVQAIDCVYFCDPKNSKIDIVQACGRALRKNPKEIKKRSYIVVPIFNRDKETVENAIEDSIFKNLVKIVRALCDQDERLEDEINNVALGKGRKHLRVNFGGVGENYSDDRILLINFGEKLKENLFAQIIDKTKNNWEIMFQKLLKYKETHGNPDIPTIWPEDASLGRWVVTNRKQYKKGELRPERIKRLEEINFTWDSFESTWQEYFNKLLKYKNVYGDTNVPQRWPEDSSLANWTLNNRQLYKNKNLNAERMEQLNKIGFILDPLETHWQENYQKLLQYIATYGDANVPKKWPENPSLGQWVGTNRNLYNEGKLSTERIEKLNKVGFIWNLIELQWQENYKKLLQYIATYGDANVPNRWPEDPSFGLWVGTNRLMHKAGKLNAERTEKLNNVRFIWNPLESQWEENYKKLIQYINQYGNSNVPANWPNDPTFAWWVGTNRQLYKKGKLNSERIEKLNKVNFIWDLLDVQWLENYKKILEYRKIYGDANVPSKWPNDPSLGIWLSTNRTLYKAGKLNQKYVNQLNDVGLIWDPIEIKWQENYKKLLEYKKIHGDTNVPLNWAENPSLGRWIITNRVLFKKGKLNTNRTEQLKKINFRWDLIDTKWEENYQKLLQYVKNHGSADVPSKWPEDPQLGEWVTQNRKQYKKGKLSSERTEKLIKVGFTWDPLEARWQENFKELLEYIKTNGNANVPNRYPDNPSLGLWVAANRRMFKTGKISAERKEKLNEIGFK